MYFVDLLKWWYGAGWMEQWQLVGKRVSTLAQTFSGGTLLRTLFAPWKQIVTEKSANDGIEEKFRALGDNLMSRTVGFFVRIFTLIAAAVSIIVFGMVNTAIAVAWPLAPLASIALIAKALGVLFL